MNKRLRETNSNCVAAIQLHLERPPAFASHTAKWLTTHVLSVLTTQQLDSLPPTCLLACLPACLQVMWLDLDVRA